MECLCCTVLGGIEKAEEKTRSYSHTHTSLWKREAAIFTHNHYELLKFTFYVKYLQKYLRANNWFDERNEENRCGPITDMLNAQSVPAPTCTR